jgi:hypothetical protein
MASDPKKYPAPFSLRLTFEERAKLEEAAAGMPLSEYIRSRLFDDGQSPRRPKRRQPVKDHQTLASLLGELGKSRIANNLNQLARAANTGSLPVTPDTESAIASACADVRQIRALLVRALGLEP